MPDLTRVISTNDLVHFIKDPAYIIDDQDRLVVRNMAFEDLTNFAHDISNNPHLYQIIRGVKVGIQIIEGKEKPHEIRIHGENGTYSISYEEKHEPIIIGDVWINCNDKEGHAEKCLVDILTFSFQIPNAPDTKKFYSLHIFQYRGERHSLPSTSIESPVPITFDVSTTPTIPKNEKITPRQNKTENLVHYRH